MTQPSGLGFYSFRERVFEMIQQDRLDEALGMAVQARAADRRRGEVPFWLACILCRLGRPQEALDTLEEGLDDGLWWADAWLREDDDLAPLRDEPRFAAVLHRSAAALAAASQPTAPGAAAPGGLTLSPTGLRADRPAGALVALHGWGQQAADTGEAWSAALDEGLHLLVPESSQVESPGFHVWTDTAAAAADVAAAYAGLRAVRAVDERRLVAAGFSQGGGLAVTYALTGRVVPAAGFVAFGAGVDDVDAGALDQARAAAARGVRGALVMGAGDPDLPGARELQERLVAAGLACPLEVLPGLGHELPGDASPLVRDALRHVLTPGLGRR